MEAAAQHEEAMRAAAAAKVQAVEDRLVSAAATVRVARSWEFPCVITRKQAYGGKGAAACGSVSWPHGLCSHYLLPPHQARFASERAEHAAHERQRIAALEAKREATYRANLEMLEGRRQAMLARERKMEDILRQREEVGPGAGAGAGVGTGGGWWGGEAAGWYGEGSGQGGDEGCRVTIAGAGAEARASAERIQCM